MFGRKLESWINSSDMMKSVTITKVITVHPSREHICQMGNISPTIHVCYAL